GGALGPSRPAHAAPHPGRPSGPQERREPPVRAPLPPADADVRPGRRGGGGVRLPALRPRGLPVRPLGGPLRGRPRRPAHRRGGSGHRRGDQSSRPRRRPGDRRPPRPPRPPRRPHSGPVAERHRPLPPRDPRTPRDRPGTPATSLTTGPVKRGGGAGDGAHGLRVTGEEVGGEADSGAVEWASQASISRWIRFLVFAGAKEASTPARARSARTVSS